MKKRLILLAGLGVGYILGSRTGRQSYERLKAQAQDLWTDPRVQDTVEKANQSLRERYPPVADAMHTAAGAVQSAAYNVNAAADAGAPSAVSDGEEDGTNAAPASADGAVSAKPEHQPSAKARDAVGDPERHLDDEWPRGGADDD